MENSCCKMAKQEEIFQRSWTCYQKPKNSFHLKVTQLGGGGGGDDNHDDEWLIDLTFLTDVIVN